MKSELAISLEALTAIQLQAVNWNHGAMLVLAGPGSGKTRVITCRIARLLNESQDERFRILALTFTNKAAHEMASRVAQLVPGLEGRATIDTFHGFCSRVLRQHGVHLGIKPNFEIYSQAADRQAVLADALARDPQLLRSENDRLLSWIDTLKARLIRPEDAERRVEAWNGTSTDDARRVARAYRLYEAELQRANALDFNSLIHKAYELFGFRAVVRHYQSVYRYWLVDELQDTDAGQYQLLVRMAGRQFRELFAVADDDQTIYEWRGASVRRISKLVDDFSCRVIQLPTNFRCPPCVVEAANRLIVYNANRFQTKESAIPAQLDRDEHRRSIQYRVFDDDSCEASGVADDIAAMEINSRSQTAVLARNRKLLERMHEALQQRDVAARILMRRDDFVSPQMRWLVACLKQVNSPADLRSLSTVITTFDHFAVATAQLDELVARSAATGATHFSLWLNAAHEAEPPPLALELLCAVSRFSSGETKLDQGIQKVLKLFDRDESNVDLQEDLSAWCKIYREIRAMRGSVSLGQLLQELELRSKEPTLPSGTVSLATIHSSKGLEFDTVYLIGLADEVLPSWHSVKPGSGSAALEEERRGCFVAITRTKRKLFLSRAHHYWGWPKDASRFLVEMGFEH